MPEPLDASRGLWAKCTACDHTWIAAMYPALVLDLARLLRGAACPKCGDLHPVLARQEDGRLLETTEADGEQL